MTRGVYLFVICAPITILVLALEDLNRTEEAVQYYDRALAIDPGEEMHKKIKIALYCHFQA